MMNFGNIGFVELVFVVLIWCVPIALLIWFVRTLTSMSAALRDIGVRLDSIERAIRETTLAAPPDAG